jgi:hypothetical protein
MRLAGPLARTIGPFSSCYRNAGGQHLRFVGARCERSRWTSGKTSHVELHPVRRFVRSLKGYSGLCRQ